jgi:hypothetical protein
VLQATNTNFRVIVGAGPYGNSYLPVHFTPGIPFQAGLALLDITAGLKALDSDGSTSGIAIVRLQTTGANAGYAEYLDAALVWTKLDSLATAYFWPVTETVPGLSRVYIKVFTAAQTLTWGAYDIFAVGNAVLDGSSYTGFSKEISVGPYAQHGLVAS